MKEHSLHDLLRDLKVMEEYHYRKADNTENHPKKRKMHRHFGNTIKGAKKRLSGIKKAPEGA